MSVRRLAPIEVRMEAGATDLIEAPPISVEADLILGRGPRGPEGPTGPPGGSTNDRSYPASEDIPVLTVVVLEPTGEVRKSDLTKPDDGWMVLGISVTSALSGEDVVVSHSGYIELDNPFVHGTLYAGPGGQLVQDPPDHGWVTPVAFVADPRLVLVRIDPTIWLEG